MWQGAEVEAAHTALHPPLPEQAYFKDGLLREDLRSELPKVPCTRIPEGKRG